MQDGAWGAWYVTTECSATCGGGVGTQKRDCNFPPPSVGGSLCLTQNSTRASEEMKEQVECNKHPCGKSKLF